MPINKPVDPDRELLTKAADKEEFFQSVLEDKLDDWELARDFGEFLLRVAPAEAVAHALLARAYRHLGKADRAQNELERCRFQVAQPSAAPIEKELFSKFLGDEEKLLDSGR